MIAILSNIDTPRLRYALGFLLEGYSFEIFTKNESIPEDFKVLSYGLESEAALIHFPCMDFPWWKEETRDTNLFRKSVERLESFGEFDLFGFAFYLLARCDEYTPEHFDEWGRFQSSGCIQRQWGGVEVAYLDEWRYRLLHALGVSETRIPNRQLTVDIDSPYAFKFKTILNQWGGFCRDIVRFKWDWVSKRVQVILGHQDPYDTYEVLKDICQNESMALKCFVLCAERSDLDKGMQINQTAGWQCLFRSIGDAEWGWHPSVLGHDIDGQYEAEMTRLEQMGCKKIQSARFHYLKHELPISSARLVALGVERDYTMGFADTVGYRAGTSRSFLWYDWHKSQLSTLRLVPFWGMDVTLKNYLHLTPEDAKMKVAAAKQYAKDFHCDWRMVWHNESVNDWSEWKGWGMVLKQFVER